MEKKKFLSKQVKKTLPYQLLVLSLIVLVVLILIWVVLFVLGRVAYFPKDDGLGGGLGTLKWDLLGTEVFIEVLNYNISGDNQTIDVNINWSSGNGDLRTVLFDFVGPMQCNYTTTTLPVFGANQTYMIDFAGTSCGLNFENITDVLIYTEVNIPLIQTLLIPDRIFYNDDSLVDIFDLDDYFSCLGVISFNEIESQNNDWVDLKINTTTNLVGFFRGSTWYGTQRFNITASCDGEVLDASTNGENMSFQITAIDSNRIIPNNAPEFLDEDCDNLEWEINVDYFIDLDDCFYDEDGDNLLFSYENVSGYNDHLTIDIQSDGLTLTPDNNWIGVGYFYVYADDSTDETRGKIYFDVVNTSTTSTPTNPSYSNILKIKSSSPSSSDINVFINKTQKLSVSAENYKSIRWYLDGKFVREGGLSYNFKEVDEGDYIIKVEVVNGTVTDSKTWNIVVEEDVIKDLLEFGSIIFYLIIGIIMLVIFLILWLFIAEKNSKKKKINYMGFGISGIKKRKN